MVSSSEFMLDVYGLFDDSPSLLSDDEYRLLRQNAFEEYSVSVIVPTEASVVPISASVDAQHFRLHTPVACMCSPTIFLLISNVHGWHIVQLPNVSNSPNQLFHLVDRNQLSPRV